MGEGEAEDHEGPGFLGGRAAGGGIGQVEVGQRDPVRQGSFLGHHQDRVAISEALDSCWDKGGSERPVRSHRLVPVQRGHGEGAGGQYLSVALGLGRPGCSFSVPVLARGTPGQTQTFSDMTTKETKKYERH